MHRLPRKYYLLVLLIAPALLFAETNEAVTSLLGNIQDYSKYGNDLSISLLGIVFGNFNDILPSSYGSLFGQLMQIFNEGVFIIAGIILSYTITLSTIHTSEEGKAIGEKTPMFWLLIRSVFGCGLLVPVSGGYSVLQTFMMTMVLNGVGLASYMWHEAAYLYQHFGDDSSSSIDTVIENPYTNIEEFSNALYFTQSMFNAAACLRYAYAYQEYSIGLLATKLAKPKYTNPKTKYRKKKKKRLEKEMSKMQSSMPSSYFDYDKMTLTFKTLPKLKVQRKHKKDKKIKLDCGTYDFSDLVSDDLIDAYINSVGDDSKAKEVKTTITIALMQQIEILFNNLYTITLQDYAVGMDEFKSYYMNTSAQVLAEHSTIYTDTCNDAGTTSYDDCDIRNSIYEQAYTFQQHMASAINYYYKAIVGSPTGINPAACTTPSDYSGEDNPGYQECISDLGGWVLAPTSYYAIMGAKAKGASMFFPNYASNKLLDIHPSLPEWWSQTLNYFRDPADTADNGDTGELTIPDSYLSEALLSKLFSDAGSAADSLNFAAFKSDLTIPDKFKRAGGGTISLGNLFQVVQAELYAAGASLLQDPNTKQFWTSNVDNPIKDSFKDDMAGANGLVNLTQAGIDIGSNNKFSISKACDSDVMDGCKISTTSHPKPNKSDFDWSSFGVGMETGVTAGDAQKDTKVIGLTNWYVASLITAWEKTFLDSSLLDPVTAVRDFGISIVTKSTKYLTNLTVIMFQSQASLMASAVIKFFIEYVLLGVSSAIEQIMRQIIKYLSFICAPFGLKEVCYVGSYAPVGAITLGIINPLFETLIGQNMIWLQLVLFLRYWWVSVVLGIVSPIIILGMMLAFYAPMIPVLIFTLCVVNWLIGVIEAMVAAPIVALGITNPQGHDFLGRAEQCIMLIFSVAIRPATIVLGFIFALIMSYGCFYLFNYMLLFLYQIFLSGAFLTQSFFTLGIIAIFSLIIYCYAILMIINQIFSLIYLLPNRIMRWVGIPVEQPEEEQWLDEVKSGVESSFSGLSRAATSGASEIASGGLAMGGAQEGGAYGEGIRGSVAKSSQDRNK